MKEMNEWFGARNDVVLTERSAQAHIQMPDRVDIIRWNQPQHRDAQTCWFGPYILNEAWICVFARIAFVDKQWGWLAVSRWKRSRSANWDRLQCVTDLMTAETISNLMLTKVTCLMRLGSTREFCAAFTQLRNEHSMRSNQRIRPNHNN